MKTVNDFLQIIGIDKKYEDFTDEQKAGFERVIAYLESKNPRDGVIIREYYQRGKTQNEIAEMLGKSKSAIFQSKNNMIRRASHPLFHKWILGE